jgi:hypothetical protein
MNSKKNFLWIGIPILIFFFFIITIYFAFMAGLFILFFIAGLTTLRKDHFWSRASKVSVSLFIIFFGLVSNPLIWPEQFDRHMNPELIITPNAPKVQELNSSTGLWAYLTTERNITKSEFDALPETEHLTMIMDFVLYTVVWTSIPEVYGVVKRVATPTEALTHGKGDCQSQACTATSFLIFLGYNAYACETPFHWYTMVLLGNGTEIFLDRVIGNGFRCSDPEIIINHEGVMYTMNWAQLLVDILIDDHMNDYLAAEFKKPVVLGMMMGLMAFCGILFTLIECRTQKKKFQQNWKQSIWGALLLGLSPLLWIAAFLISPFAFNSAMFITILGSVQVIFWRVRKSEIPTT